MALTPSQNITLNPISQNLISNSFKSVLKLNIFDLSLVHYFKIFAARLVKSSSFVLSFKTNYRGSQDLPLSKEKGIHSADMVGLDIAATGGLDTSAEMDG